jgi:hypothetical protein
VCNNILLSHYFQVASVGTYPVSVRASNNVDSAYATLSIVIIDYTLIFDKNPVSQRACTGCDNFEITQATVLPATSFPYNITLATSPALPSCFKAVQNKIVVKSAVGSSW